MSELSLADAIRLGAMLKRKAVGRLLDSEGNTCALGAACEAVGIAIRVHQKVLNNATFKRWPILRERATCPVRNHWGRSETASVSVIIQSLNDFSGWTREQIADWVESLETQPSAQPTQESPTSLVTAQG